MTLEQRIDELYQLKEAMLLAFSSTRDVEHPTEFNAAKKAYEEKRRELLGDLSFLLERASGLLIRTLPDQDRRRLEELIRAM